MPVATAVLLALHLVDVTPTEVRLHFRPAPAAERVVLGEVVLSPHDLAGDNPSDEEFLRALRAEAARSGADTVLDVSFGANEEGPFVRGRLARESSRHHGVRAKNGLVLFFVDEGMPPRGERVRDLEARFDELPAGTPPSRRALLGLLTRKAKALGGDAIAMVEIANNPQRARGVVIRKRVMDAPAPAPEVPKGGVVVDDGWYDAPPAPIAPRKPIGDLPPDPAD